MGHRGVLTKPAFADDSGRTAALSDLELDFDELRTSANRASDAKRTFDGVQLTSDIIAGAVGHDGLAAQIRDFDEKWSIARGKLSEQLQFISDSLNATVETFQDLDYTLRDRLSE